MKQRGAYGTATAASGAGGAAAGARAGRVRPNTGPELAMELARTRRALARSERDLRAARERIESLAGRNAHLERELRELACREARARRFAYHDELTGLPNRRLLHDRLRRALARARRLRQHVALLLLDLDDFKTVNDRLGHDAGDAVLRMVAQRLASSIRAEDTACRYGGDEFVIVLQGGDDGARTVRVALEKLQRALGAPYAVGGFDIHMTTSAGVILYPGSADSAAELLHSADRSLYRSKSERGRVHITGRCEESSPQA